MRVTRRDFLQQAAGAAALAPAGMAAAGNLRLGIDCYSIRGLRWNLDRLLDYADGLKLDMIQPALASFESFDEAYLRRIRERAARLGIWVEPGYGCICPRSKGWSARQGEPAVYLRDAIRVTRALDSPSFKVFMGNAADRRGGASIPALIEATLPGLRAVRSEALDAGVKIAVENHGDLEARQLKTLIEEAGKDFVAACLDSGNSTMVLEDPLYTLEVLGPYIVTSHLRDSAVYEHPRGAAVQWVALGDGTVDFRRFAARFREVCPRAPFQLEILTGSPPRVLPYLEPDFWKEFPDTPASQFAGFLALARRGQPFAGSMMIAGPGKQPPEYEAALLEQQRVDLERSVEYCKKTLNAGVRWRA